MDLVNDIDPQQDNAVLVMNTYFYAKVKQQSVDETSFQQAEKWIIKAHGSNADMVQHFFEKGGHLIFPNHKKGNPVGHWFSTKVDFMNRKVCFMDSVLQDHTADFDVIVSFLKYLQRDTVKCKLNERQMEEIQVPTQQNGYDCGVFTALFTLYSVFSIFKNRWGLVHQLPMFPFHQSDIENVRYAMTVALMENSFTTVLEKWFLDFYTSNSYN
jgi:Ulp1 family protease